MQEWMWQSDKMLGSHLVRVVQELSEQASRRKIRLFSAACCRLISDTLKDERLKTALPLAEQLADGLASDDERCVARLATDDVLDRNPRGRPQITDQELFEAVYVIDGLLADSPKEGVEDVVRYTGAFRDPNPHFLLLREIFGNPFLPISFDLEWRTSTAVAIAKGIYESRDFSAMPILADALQDAGCDNEDVLDHCRAVDGVHVRGCWVVDLVLGKA
jgi:hypothetical protein